METKVGSRRRSKLATRSAAREPPEPWIVPAIAQLDHELQPGGDPEIFEAETFETALPAAFIVEHAPLRPQSCHRRSIS